MSTFGLADDLDQIAARNNADWCAAMWRAHGLSVEQGPGLTFCHGTSPRFFPNVVTTDRNGDPAAQAAVIADLCAKASDAPFGVKDSFARLDLAGLGFELLFEARWVFRGARSEASPAGPISWRRLESPADLEAWEAAWGESAGGPRIFPPVLLGDPAVHILAGVDAEGRIRAGGVANEAAGVLGLSNLFGSRRGAVLAAASLHPELDLVGYESGNALKAMEYHGFSSLGPLRVWVRPLP